MGKLRKVAFAIVAAAVLAAPKPASATSILVDGNTSFQVSWFYDGTNPDLSGDAVFTITNWSDTSFTLTISSITNSTATSPDINADLVSFGFGLSPDATSFGTTTNGTLFSFDTSNFPAFQTVDICATVGTNCAGGGNDGLGAGQTSSDILTIVINGDFADGVTFAPMPVKFQTSLGSYEFDGGDPCIDCDITPVPEPASLLLLGTGLVTLGHRVRRRRR